MRTQRRRRPHGPGPAGSGAAGAVARLARSGNVHHPRTRLVWMENTHNLGGGRIQPYDVVAAICRWAAAEGLRTHLDGARLFNAVVATGIEAARWTQHFDTVSICFSKGLGARSAGAGRIARPRAEAVRHRKVLGGGMRRRACWRRPHCTPWSITWPAWQTITPMPAGWPTASPAPTACGWTRSRSTRTCCSFASLRRWQQPGSSSPGCGIAGY